MKDYNQVDQLLHQLSQVIAKFNRTYIPSREDDSHTNIYFDSLGSRIMGRWVDSEKGKITLVLKVDELAYALVDQSNREIFHLPVVGKEISVMESEIEGQLIKLGLAADSFRDKLHFGIPDYGFNKTYSAFSEAGLQEWVKQREMANHLCELLIGHLQQESETRIWPHHFDTGIYIQASSSVAVGLGLAMEDDMVGSPYYYMAGYALVGELSFTELPDIEYSKWIINENWKGAVLPLSALGDDPSQWEERASNFISQSLNWYLEHKKQA